jgi:hypothetical protein
MWTGSEIRDNEYEHPSKAGIEIGIGIGIGLLVWQVAHWPCAAASIPIPIPTPKYQLINFIAIQLFSEEEQ